MTSHPIPAAALAQHIAVLGKTGSGKTTTAKLAIEEIVAGAGRVCILEQRQVFEALLGAIDNRMPRAEIAASIGWEAGGSNLRNRLSELSSLELVEYPAKGEVALQGWVTS